MLEKDKGGTDSKEYYQRQRGCVTEVGAKTAVLASGLQSNRLKVEKNKTTDTRAFPPFQVRYAHVRAHSPARERVEARC